MQLSVIWLIAGALLVGIDVLHVPGIGFLFAGLGAVVTGGAIEFKLIDATNYMAQVAVFLITTTLFAALLWQKIKAWRLNPSVPEYSNIVGTEATVAGNPLRVGKVGQVKWSGTLMRAKLADGPVSELAEGAIVTVESIEGNVLSVAPKKF